MTDEKFKYGPLQIGIDYIETTKSFTVVIFSALVPCKLHEFQVINDITSQVINIGIRYYYSTK